MNLLLYALSAGLLAAAVACTRMIRRSRTARQAASWLALTGAACAGAMLSAMAAGGPS